MHPFPGEAIAPNCTSGAGRADSYSHRLAGRWARTPNMEGDQMSPFPREGASFWGACPRLELSPEFVFIPFDNVLIKYSESESSTQFPNSISLLRGVFV